MSLLSFSFHRCLLVICVLSFSLLCHAQGDAAFVWGRGISGNGTIWSSGTADAAGNVYVADSYNSSIRKVTPAGEVSTLAGNGTYGFQDGTGSSARFSNPPSLTVDAAGFVYVADNANNSVRRISPTGEVATLAGDGTQGFQDGSGTMARFRDVSGVADGGHGYLYVTDYLNFRIRQISPTGIVSTIAGGSTEGFKDGVGLNAEFSNPLGITVDHLGNIYVVDAGNFRIRKLE